MMMTLVILLILVLFGSVRCDFNCLTWDVIGSKLQLTCRISDFIEPVAFFDTNGNRQAKCHFNNSVTSCFVDNKLGHIEANMSENAVFYTLTQIDPRYVDGEWACVKGNKTFTTIVSIHKGIYAATDLIISGEYLTSNRSKIKVICFSCRPPYGRIIEFFQNHNTVDTLYYNPIKKNCFSINGECASQTCSCLLSGTEFIRIFPVNETKDNSTFYSCQTQYTDTVTSAKFSKYASINVTNRAITVLETITKTTKFPDRGLDYDEFSTERTTIHVNTSKPKQNDDNEKSSLTGVITSIVMTILLVVIATCSVFIIYRYTRKRCRTGKQTRTEENYIVLEAKAPGESADKETYPLLEAIVPGKTEIEERDLEERDLTDKTHLCDTCISLNRVSHAAKFWCFECVKRLCLECRNSHKKQEDTKDHQIVELDKLKQIFDKFEEKPIQLQLTGSQTIEKTEYPVEKIPDKLSRPVVNTKPTRMQPIENQTVEEDNYSSENNGEEFTRKELQSQTAVSKNYISCSYQSTISMNNFDSCIISGMVVVLNLLYVCDCFKPRILVCGKNGSNPRSIRIQYIPWEIALIPNENRVVVTSIYDDYVQFVDIDNNTSSYEMHIDEISEGGISCSDEYIFVGGSNKIHILNLNGDYLRAIENITERKAKVRFISHHEGRIAFTEYGSNIVICVNVDGLVLFRYNSEQLDNPMKVLSDELGNYFVLGRYSNNMIILNEHGQFIGTALSKDDGLQGPRSMCYDKNSSELFVFNTTGKGQDVLVFNVRDKRKKGNQLG